MEAAVPGRFCTCFVAQVSQCLSLEVVWGRDVNALVVLWLVQNQNRLLTANKSLCLRLCYCLKPSDIGAQSYKTRM